MKILVTGGAGFIGSHIVDAYLADGHDVAVVDDLSSGDRARIPDGVRFYEADIRDQNLDEIFQKERPTLVNHQAARANVRESMEKPLVYADVNVLGSLNVLECCRRHGVSKIIYASTGGAVYGTPVQLPVPETHPVNPLDSYGASKHHVEHYLYIYQEHFGIAYTALRYPNVFGQRQDPNGEAGVVAIFTGQMLGNRQPVINGTGEQERDFVHVSDVARASVLAVTRADNEILNIGSGHGTSVNTIYQALRKHTGFDREPAYGPAKLGEVFQIYLDATRAHDLLGWQPEVGLDEGLKATVDYLRLAHDQVQSQS